MLQASAKTGACTPPNGGYRTKPFQANLIMLKCKTNTDLSGGAMSEVFLADTTYFICYRRPAVFNFD